MADSTSTGLIGTRKGESPNLMLNPVTGEEHTYKTIQKHKRDILSMIDQEANAADIDGYMKAFGVTMYQLHNPPAKIPESFSTAFKSGAARGAADFTGFMTGMDPIGTALSYAAEKTGASPSMVEGLRDPLGGGKRIRGGLEALGVDTEAGKGTLGGFLGEELTSAGLFGTGVAARASRVPAMTRNLVESGRNPTFINPIVESYIRNPKTHVAAEVAAGTGAAAGRYVADSVDAGPGLELLGEIGGSLLGTTTASGLHKLAQTGYAVSARGRERAVASVLQEAVTNRDAALSRLTGENTGSPDLDYALNTAEIASDVGLSSIFKQLSGEAYDRSSREQDTRRNRLLLDELGEALGDYGEATPQKTKQFVTGYIRKARGQVSKIMAHAKQRVVDTVGQLTPGMSQTQAAITAQEIITQAEKRMRNLEAEAWAKVPQREGRSIESLREIMFDMLRKTEAADDPTNIPAWAVRLIGLPPWATKDLKDTAGALADTLPAIDQRGRALYDFETLSGLQALRSRLLTAMRKANASGEGQNRELAANLNKLQSEVLEIMTSGKGGAEWESARALSGELNSIFTLDGPVSKIMAGSRRPDAGIQAGTVLQGLSSPGPKGKQFLDLLRRASPEVEKAANDHLMSDFQKTAVNTDGLISTSDGERFLRDHEEVLSALPALKTRILAAVAAQRRVDYLDKRIQFKSKAYKTRAQASNWMELDPELAMIKTLGSANPVHSMRAMVKVASKDLTGETLEGLRRTFFDTMMNRIRKGDDDLSYVGLDKWLTAKRPVMEILYTPEQIGKVDQIVSAVKKVIKNKNVTTTGAGSPIEASSLALLVGKITGGIFGRSLGTGTLQAPQAFSNAFGALLTQATVRQAEQLLQEALFDRKLMTALLERNTASSRGFKAVTLARGHLANWQSDDQLLNEPVRETTPASKKLISTKTNPRAVAPLGFATAAQQGQ